MSALKELHEASHCELSKKLLNLEGDATATQEDATEHALQRSKPYDNTFPQLILVPSKYSAIFVNTVVTSLLSHMAMHVHVTL